MTSSSKLRAVRRSGWARAGMAIALVLMAAVAAVAATGCAGDREEAAGSGGAGGAVGSSKTRLVDPQDAIGPALMLALGQAKNFHHKARVYMNDGKPEQAIAAVRSVLAVGFPAGAPEAEDVRADARALLAKLLVAQGEVDAAMSEIDAGLASATRESFFVANLYTVKGEVLEAQAARLGTAAPEEVTRSRELRRQAIVAFDKSISINLALQQRLMEQRP